MILESAQILSTVLRENGCDVGYKATHKNHPCVLWAGRSLSNFKWLVKLSFFLNEEYRFRYKKEVNHKSYDLIKTLPMPAIADLGLTPFEQCMPTQYKNENAVTAYREYYCQEKRDILQYKNQNIPEWIKLKEETK
jgi:hypothetical protein